MGQHEDVPVADRRDDGLAVQLRAGADVHFGHLPAAVGLRSSRKAPSPWPVMAVMARIGAVSIDVLRAKTLCTALSEPGDEVLVEHAQDDAHVGVERPHHEHRGDVEQIVAGEDEDAARSATPAASRISRRRQSPLTRRTPRKRGSSAGKWCPRRRRAARPPADIPARAPDAAETAQDDGCSMRRSPCVRFRAKIV